MGASQGSHNQYREIMHILGMNSKSFIIRKMLNYLPYSHDNFPMHLFDCNLTCIVNIFLQVESHFWRRKMRTLHSHLDVNKDGVLSYDDFMLLGERFAKLGHLTDQQKEEFQAVLRVSFQTNLLQPFGNKDIFHH